MTSAVITIGNEILLGTTLNTNMAYLGAALAKLGIPLAYSVVVKDDPEQILQALADTWGKYDVVISTGGLGPTEDDLSKAAIAQFFGTQLYFDEVVWQYVQSLFAIRGMKTPETNRSQAMVPAGFTVLKNERGTAPGLYYKKEESCFFALQGVPLEMKYIFETHIRGILKTSYPFAKQVYQKTIHTHGVSESKLAELFPLAALPKVNCPEELSLAWLPQTGRVDLRFYGSSQKLIDEARSKALKIVAPYVWGFDNEVPAQVLLKLLVEKNHTLSAAESCTGGWLQKLITDQPGSSQAFVGGAVSYANEIKQSLLQVSENTLTAHGAVSEECASEMVTGIKRLTNSSHALSVTGIAGPDGGSVEKTVGTVYFGFIAATKCWTIKQIFTGDRDSIRLKAAEFAILELIKTLQGRNN
ncbi:MAG: CinA family nicotinamide mononucleotide deamidase-related protein [Candidatus Cloacimonas sp.]|jgi:nicotinamide-nucleotide amidase|nr:CinA family nicotinamide mononucleotide deamidase-related protein [Candidatus Cloacimonas sp.]